MNHSHFNLELVKHEQDDNLYLQIIHNNLAEGNRTKSRESIKSVGNSNLSDFVVLCLCLLIVFPSSLNTFFSTFSFTSLTTSHNNLRFSATTTTTTSSTVSLHFSNLFNT
ncbi:hypothetical protein V8G54_019532 [Vigna mungo]|uniref:Transmembrane protein n=1 Tax=Vigna mungo TaxID=3915 RepID=A0AAQ3NC44_VIGMU